MSSLLEKAIVDATALKEAALKNAENLVIEKYSQEIKDAMNALLEQEGDEFLADTLTSDDPIADPMADPMAAAPTGTDKIADDIPLKALDGLGLSDTDDGDTPITNNLENFI